MWKTISWKGNFGADKDECPSDEEFKINFERVLNPPPTPPPLNVSTVVTIPVLDDPISPAKVECQKSKIDKACGPDGLSPGVLTVLPAHWVLTITALFNAVFESGVYPESWRSAKVFAVFKRGDK